MAELNLYYNSQTNSWWTDKEIDGFTFRKYISENPIGLGTIEFNTDVSIEEQAKGFYKVYSNFVPEYLKQFYCMTKDINKNRLDKFTQVTDKELENFLNSEV